MTKQGHASELDLVTKHRFILPSFTTAGGKSIRNVNVGWEAYGKLNAAKDNVILIPHFFSSNSHAAGRYRETDPEPGYWDSIIGPGKAIDTDLFYVVSVDSLVNMNSKDGITITTGPSSIDPETGQPYGLSFPVVTIRDFVQVQKALFDSLGITKLHAVAGTSMGGLQAFEWAAAFPEMVERVICVGGTATQNPFSVLSLETWCAPIRLDPAWNMGNYYDGAGPLAGLELAFFNVAVRAFHPEWAETNFGHRWTDPEKDPMAALENEFASDRSLKDLSVQRAKNTDANNMLYMTKANQLFVAGTPGSSVAPGLENIKARTLMISVRTDLLFPSADAHAQVARLKANGTHAEFFEIDSGIGHMAGVSDIGKASHVIRDFLTP
ncbi:homoserine O-acetyltransferase [soil metagenome]